MGPLREIASTSAATTRAMREVSTQRRGFFDGFPGWRNVRVRFVWCWRSKDCRSRNTTSLKDTKHEHLTLDYSDTIGVTFLVCGWDQVLLHNPADARHGTAESDSLSGMVYSFHRRVRHPWRPRIGASRTLAG